MDAVFKKLNFRDQKHACVVGAPESFESNLREMEGLTQIDRSARPGADYPFFLAFVTSEEEVGSVVALLRDSLSPDDPILWMAYPKKSSKKYSATINRDHGWQALGDLGFEPVRQVAIDEDWSALRFRHVDSIKELKRDKKWRLTGN